jgi:hypothetical protein
MQKKILYHVQPLLGSGLEAGNETTLAAGQQTFYKYKRPLLDNVFANEHVLMEMTGATTEELCFPHGPCRGVISETRFRAESVESQAVKRRLYMSCSYSDIWSV